MENHRVAVFIDFDNIRIGIRQHFNAEIAPHKIMAKARKYGSVVEARAYADFTEYARDFRDRILFAAGIQPVHAPIKISGGRRQSSADLHMVLDIFMVALDRPEVDTIVLMTGDGDFMRMVALLRNRFQKRVIISGVKGTSTSTELELAADISDPVVPADCDPAGSVAAHPRPRDSRQSVTASVPTQVSEPTQKGSVIGSLIGGLLGRRREESPVAAATESASDLSSGRRRRRRGGTGRNQRAETDTATPAPAASTQAEGAPAPARRTTRRTTEPSTSRPAATANRPARTPREPRAPRVATPVTPRELTPELTERLIQCLDGITPGRGGFVTWKVMEETLRARASEMGWTRKEASGLLDSLREEGVVLRTTRMRGQTEQQIGELVREHPAVRYALGKGAAEVDPVPVANGAGGGFI
ncbi:MAG: NYN domain-containing protein [Candidatus Dormibacteria bacterium]